MVFVMSLIKIIDDNHDHDDNDGVCHVPDQNNDNNHDHDDNDNDGGRAGSAQTPLAILLCFLYP